MISYLNNIITLVLWVDFVNRRFPNEIEKIRKITSNGYIFLYSYFELQMKKNGIDIFCEPQIEQISITNNDEDFNSYNDEIWNIISKYQQEQEQEKEKISLNKFTQLKILNSN